MSDAPTRERPTPPARYQAQSSRFKLLPHYIPPQAPSEKKLYDRVKPIFEWCLAAFLVIPALPVIVLAAFVVKLTSRGPAFFTQMRLGRHGQPYLLVKIRTMYDQSERLTGPVWSRRGDRRITPVGHFLRNRHIDELPQLWNVLRGEMTLVGPRPERPEIVPSLEQQIPGYIQRLGLRPGVTGLAQLQLPADTDIDSVRRKLSYDFYYIRRHDFWLDLRLIVCTAFVMLGMPYRVQHRLFILPHPENVDQVSRPPLERLGQSG